MEYEIERIPKRAVTVFIKWIEYTEYLGYFGNESQRVEKKFANTIL